MVIGVVTISPGLVRMILDMTVTPGFVMVALASLHWYLDSRCNYWHNRDAM